MRTQIVLGGIVALAALAILPLQASAAPPPLPSVTVSCVITNPTYCTSMCSPFAPTGGVVGATESYADSLAGIACNTEHQEVAWASATATNACDTTAQFLLGTGCTTTVCMSSSCDPTPIGPGPVIVPAVTGPSVTESSSTIIIRCAIIGPSGAGGVVGQTEDYAGAMSNQLCNAALSQVFIVANAAIQACNATGQFLIGQGNLCVTTEVE